MSTVAQIEEILQRVLGPRADELARETHFVRGLRTLDGSDFVQGLVFGYLHQADATTEDLAQILGRREVDKSRVRIVPTLYPSSRRVVRAGDASIDQRGHASRAAGSCRVVRTF